MGANHQDVGGAHRLRCVSKRRLYDLVTESRREMARVCAAFPSRNADLGQNSWNGPSISLDRFERSREPTYKYAGSSRSRLTYSVIAHDVN